MVRKVSLILMTTLFHLTDVVEVSRRATSKSKLIKEQLTAWLLHWSKETKVIWTLQNSQFKTPKHNWKFSHWFLADRETIKWPLGVRAIQNNRSSKQHKHTCFSPLIKQHKLWRIIHQLPSKAYRLFIVLNLHTKSARYRKRTALEVVAASCRTRAQSRAVIHATKVSKRIISFWRTDMLPATILLINGILRSTSQQQIRWCGVYHQRRFDTF